jgi:uncharacterized protein
MREAHTTDQHTFTAFAGDHRIASGSVQAVLTKTKECFDRGETRSVLVFDDDTGEQIDFDFRGTAEQVISRIASHPHFAGLRPADGARPGPGRPKLGVVCREVSLLPRHWEWLEQQPGGMSVALRKLVDEARKREPDRQHARAARDAAGKFMWAMAGNLPDFEEASRALFAGDRQRLDALIRSWPEDIRAHVERLVDRVPRAAETAAQ